MQGSAAMKDGRETPNNVSGHDLTMTNFKSEEGTNNMQKSRLKFVKPIIT